MGAHGDIPKLVCPKCGSDHVHVQIIGTMNLRADTWSLLSFSLDAEQDVTCLNCDHEDLSGRFKDAPDVTEVLEQGQADLAGAIESAAHPLKPLFYLEGRRVFHRPVRTATGWSMGFPVCDINEFVSEPEQVLAMLNKASPPDPNEPPDPND